MLIHASESTHQIHGRDTRDTLLMHAMMHADTCTKPGWERKEVLFGKWVVRTLPKTFFLDVHLPEVGMLEKEAGGSSRNF